MKRILLSILAITLFGGVVIAQRPSKAEIARQLILTRVTPGADINTTQVPETGDLQEMQVASENYSSASRLTHLYFQQHIQKIPVHNGILNVHLTDDNRLFSFSSRFVKEAGSQITDASPALTAEQAVAEAARQLGYTLNEQLVVKQTKGGPTRQVVFEKGSLSQEDIPVSLVWQPVEDFLSPTHAVSLKLAWDISIFEPSGNNWWSVRIDAHTGVMLDKGNWVVSCNFGDHDNNTLHGADRPHVHSTKEKTGGLDNYLPAIGASYNVFPQPFESPYDGARQLIANPADATASPYGWHDINGVAGAEYTITRGNNVHAYTDVDGNNGPDLNSSPDGGAGLMFDFALDLNNHPSTYRPAAVTNLFYWNNYMHDFAYKYGFDEASGNFQVNNYGKGGTGNDDVRAEAQDGSGSNNANFFTPPDGQRPRMQMFLWTKTPANVKVNSPSGIMGDYFALENGFSTANRLSNLGPLTGDVVYYNDDAGGTSHLGCGVPTNNIAGKIALIDRGTCNFSIKAKNAQNAGAIGVIIVNNVPGPPSTMSGTDNTITIPAVMISQSDGGILKAELANTVNVTLTADPTIVRDSDLDNGIIAHEYAHGISTRLTGGPANSNCLNNLEQMGEGWSDYFALMTTMKPTDVGTMARGIGNYSNGDPANGAGIRPQPYSTDQGINNATYNTIKNPAITQPHGIGFVWNTMLWEMTWALIDAHGMANGYDMSMKLVMEGMKLQPCSPGFVDGRDAILKADTALYGGANACLIWRAFAKRGLGVSASQGSSNDRNDGTQAFDVPAGCGGLSVSAATGTITICPGEGPSASPNLQQIIVTGTGLATDVSVQAPADFDISLNQNSGFGKTLTIPAAGGNVPATVVYVRSSATVSGTGNISSEVTFSTTGYAPMGIQVNVFVNPRPVPVIISSVTDPTCPGDPVTLSAIGAISTTPCTVSINGKFPLSDFSFTACNTGTLELITSSGWAGEYSVVNVVAGKWYGFWVFGQTGVPNYINDVVTITDIDGINVYSAGINFAYFVSPFTGKIRFYSNTAGCGAENTGRQRYASCMNDGNYLASLGPVFSWSPGGAATSSITVNPLVTTNYVLTYNQIDFLGGIEPCTGTGSKTVNVKTNQECGLPSTWYRDADKDGYGNPNPAFIKVQVEQPRNYVLNNLDCRDWDPLSYPGANEIGDGIDNDCDGETDEGLPCRKTWYYDGDGDGYGSDNHTRLSCIQHNNFVEFGGDCKNWDPEVYPGKGCAPLPVLITGVENSTQPKALVSLSSDMMVFPNPASNEITVILNGFEAGKKLDLTLLQADGKPMIAQSAMHTADGQQVQMDVRRLSSGYYLLKVNQGPLQQIKKVMIIR